MVRRRDFSLAECALLISAAVQGISEPEFDLIGHLARLDDLAAGVPSPTALGVYSHLTRVVGLSGDRENYYAAENSLLDRVLARGRGIPITLSVVMIEVARRVGVPLVGVGLPGHFVVGVPDAGRLVEFFDPFTPQGPMGPADCELLVSRLARRPLRLPPEVFAPQPAIAVIERMLNNLKSILQRQPSSTPAVSALRSVMGLRAELPTIGSAETDEWRRMMAPLN
jgi:regulator of sirC expression with transglutaminase-like and TPR domain